MGRANALGLVEVDLDMLFIFDLNSITTRQHLENEPLSLAVFTELVNTFKDIGVDGYMFKYVADENLIISDSKALTIDYINRLKEKVKAEYRPLNIEEVFTFTSHLRHIDIANTEADFINKYNVSSDLLISTTIDYSTKTITIKSKCKPVERTIPYFVANLIESCVYISYYTNRMQFNETTKPIKYPYRELIRDLYTIDFVNRNVPITLPNEEEVKFNLEGKFVQYNSVKDASLDVANTIESIIKEEFVKSEDTGYVESIDTITDDQINEYFEQNQTIEDVKPQVINPFNIYDKQDN